MIFTWLSLYLHEKLFVISNCKMDLDTSRIQLQYLGFLNTPLLWKSVPVLGMHQLRINTRKASIFEGNITKNLRLGKRIERFVSHQLEEYNAISVSAENIQIQQNKLTLGELDCLLMVNNIPTHLEVVYKFYLYDESVGTSEIDHWIGPNRNDSLIQKLTKLKDKQLPLLYAPETKPILDVLNINAESMQQRVYFKAQLFVPLSDKEVSFKLLNSDCLTGFYVRLDELKQFSDCKFYIPTKVDWLMEIQTQIDWLTYELFFPKIEEHIAHKISSLCWVKTQKGKLLKCFVVWWS